MLNKYLSPEFETNTKILISNLPFIIIAFIVAIGKVLKNPINNNISALIGTVILSTMSGLAGKFLTELVMHNTTMYYLGCITGSYIGETIFTELKQILINSAGFIAGRYTSKK